MYVLEKHINADGKSPLYFFSGTSTDQEPSGSWLTENSQLRQNDTGVKKYYHNGEWVAMATPGSGGGGGQGGGGSAEPTYETIFSVTMPQTTLDDGFYSASFPFEDLSSEEKEVVMSMFNDSDNLYINNINLPLEKVSGGSQVIYLNNSDGEHLIDGTKPAYAVLIFKNGSEYSGIAVGSTEDITGDTIEIIKRTGSGEEGSLVITIPNVDFQQETLGTPDASVAEIGEAVDAGNLVYLRLIQTTGDVVFTPIKSAYKASGMYAAFIFEIETEPYLEKYTVFITTDNDRTSAQIEKSENNGTPFFFVEFTLDVDQEDNVIMKSTTTLSSILNHVSDENKVIMGRCVQSADLTLNGDTVHFDVVFLAPLTLSKMTAGDASSYYMLSTLFEGNTIEETYTNTSDIVFFKL